MTGDENITLRQGLKKFHDENRDYLSHDEEWVSSEAKDFFASHDIAHVIFDCGTSLFGEGSVKIWTIFGTTLSFRKHIRGYREASAFELSKDFGIKHIAGHIFNFLTCIPIIIFRARRMSKPWPWSDFEPYLDVPIAEIRKEFNIQTLQYKPAKMHPKRKPS